MNVSAAKKSIRDVIVSDLRRNAMVVALILVVILFALLPDGVSVRSDNISKLMELNG